MKYGILKLKQAVPDLNIRYRFLKPLLEIFYYTAVSVRAEWDWFFSFMYT